MVRSGSSRADRGQQRQQHQQLEGREGAVTNEAVTPQPYPVRPSSGIAKAMGLRVGGGREGGQCMGSADCLHHPSYLSLSLARLHPASTRPPPFWLACWLADKLYRPAYLQQHGIIQQSVCKADGIWVYNSQGGGGGEARDVQHKCRKGKSNSIDSPTQLC